MKSAQLIILGIIFSSTTLFSQANQWKVYNTSNSGLPHDHTEQIVQDNEGNYWIGAYGSIAKFDGSTWTTFTTQNSNIRDGLVKDIVFDGTTIWIGYAYLGISKFDGTTFTHYDLDDILNTPFAGSGQIQGMDIDNNHNLWLATYNGLIKFDGTNFTRYHIGNGLISEDNRVWSVKCDNSTNNIVWVGTFEGGLLKFDGTNFTQYYLYDPNLPWFGEWQQVNRIIFDAEGDIWVSGVGVFEFDKNTMEQKAVYNSNNGLGDPIVWGIAFDQTGKLWVGSDCLDGVFCLNNGTWITYNETNSGFPQGTCYSVFNIHVDSYNNVWMAHYAKGIVVYNEAGNVGIGENKSSSTGLMLFPNPANNNINFNINFNEVTSLEVYDYTGKLILIKPYSGMGNNLELEIASMNPGMYSYRLQTITSNYSGKFIKE